MLLIVFITHNSTHNYLKDVKASLCAALHRNIGAIHDVIDDPAHRAVLLRKQAVHSN